MRSSFKRSAIGLCLAVITAALPNVAVAQGGGNHGIPQGRQWIWVGIGMVNHSDACAWVTFYWSYKSEAHWRIAGGGNRPRWVAPGQRFGGREKFNHPVLGPQIRTRAEVMSTASGQCTGSKGRPDLTRQINLSPGGPGRDCSADTELHGSRTTSYRLIPNQQGYGCR